MSSQTRRFSRVRSAKRSANSPRGLIDTGSDIGVSVEIDASDRTRHGEPRAGAAPIEVIAVLLYAVSVGSRQLARLEDKVFDAVVDWVLRHRQKDPPPKDPVAVHLYGPDGEILKRVHVPQ